MFDFILPAQKCDRFFSLRSCDISGLVGKSIDRKSQQKQGGGGGKLFHIFKTNSPQRFLQSNLCGENHLKILIYKNEICRLSLCD